MTEPGHQSDCDRPREYSAPSATRLPGSDSFGRPLGLLECVLRVRQRYGAAMTTWTLIDEQRRMTVEMGADLRLDPSILGWQRKPEGLCRDDVCIPISADKSLDLAEIARLLGRPMVIDRDERIVALAASATERTETWRTGMAPDFELPDVDGVMHRLSDHRGRKVVLYAYASW